MLDRFAKLPSSLDGKARTVKLAGDIPALLVHPDWISCVPTIIWMHGRTANKELDAGRYVRWMKSGPPGIAACAIDLPGHGERKDSRAETPGAALDVLAQAIGEIDRIVEALADPVWQNVFDLDRLGLGGMSLGGMATLRRLCDPHPFIGAAVESTTGDLTGLYRPDGPRPWGTSYPLETIAPLDPMRHLDGFRPIPLLALHTEADRIVPIGLQRGFLDRLAAHYREQHTDPSLITLHTWPTTGAPEEHSGFGRHGNEAKNMQTAFFARQLLGIGGR